MLTEEWSLRLRYRFVQCVVYSAEALYAARLSLTQSPAAEAEADDDNDDDDDDDDRMLQDAHLSPSS